MDIKIRLIQLGKKQVDLLMEIHRRGHTEVTAAEMSNSLAYRLRTPKSCNIRKWCDEILTEWEKEKEGK